MALAQGDVEGVLHAWRNVHDALRSCFPRRDSREPRLRSRVGLWRPWERQSIAPLALEGDGGQVRARQRFVREARWDEAQMRHLSPPLVSEEMGAPAGGVRVDESGVPKPGQDAVGVARPSCGTWGQVETCPVGVCAA